MKVDNARELGSKAICITYALLPDYANPSIYLTFKLSKEDLQIFLDYIRLLRAMFYTYRLLKMTTIRFHNE